MNSLAQDLWDARRLGRIISAARDDLPKTKDEAYEVQDAIAELSGLPRCGYKVGSTSKEAQLLLGTDEPGLGVLLTPFVHESPRPDRDRPGTDARSRGRVRFPHRPRPPAARRAIHDRRDRRRARGCGRRDRGRWTRFSGGLEGKGRLLTTADGGVNIALATGRWAEFSGEDLRAHRVTMTINDDLRGTGTGSRALGDPLNVLLWIANRQSKRHVGLKAGEIVSTGTCTGLDFVQPGDVARADFGALGAVVIKVE